MRTELKRLFLGLWFCSAVYAADVQAGLKVMTTLPDLRAMIAEVGGAEVSVESIAKGTQDPHFLEAKPSFMVKLARADLVVSVGLELESAWLDSIVRGARNPGILPGEAGNLELGPRLEPLEVAQGQVSRSDGDVHPSGNPHVTLDPIRMGKAALLVAERLALLDSENASKYRERAKVFQARLALKTEAWKKRVAASGVKAVITYHKTLTYFLDRFGVSNPGILEPKPGIPPTSGHILKIIQLMRTQKIPLILVENYFDPSVTGKVKSELPAVRTAVVPVSVEGAEGIDSTEALIETLVKVIEGQ